MILSKEDSFEEIIDILENNGVVIVPCDTIYGILGKSPDTDSIIRSIKGRGEAKPFLHLISSVIQFNNLSVIPFPEDLEQYWPGPLTVVTTVKKGGTIAYRLPADPFLQDIVSHIECPLYSTSVNTSGQKHLWKINDIIDKFENKVDLIVDDGDYEGREPSTVIDITSTPYKLIRQGVLKLPSQLLSQ
ncbi:threonylcarbamoyl-AMP synthase [Thiospirochaeta perfilievii]|uniref:L-threonylcarbamoyladenylate synthase n=1 Tax=Thiospirochaeta perfilievii TaxID=252967 RepID=A0A5C1QC77_9SPIO|nr:L-threonylcarbamoyladenylate synthase [Thiospirochaeta perfilievii]QEN04266.1 threonylcarbamoyl-AMP synthase [Thiospirochaeta perfilievii]